MNPELWEGMRLPMVPRDVGDGSFLYMLSTHIWWHLQMKRDWLPHVVQR